jgi:hypothetical protein
MEAIMQLIVTQGAGVVALTIVFYQYYAMPKRFEMNKKIIESLKKVIEENGRTMLAVVKILNNISERLTAHENRAHELEYKLESITENIQRSLQSINDCNEEMKTSLTKIEIYSEHKK